MCRLFFLGGGSVFTLEVASFNLGQVKGNVWIHGKPFIKTNKQTGAAAF